MTLSRRHIALAALCGGTLLISSPLFWPANKPPRVNVRWRESVTPSTRAALEAQYRLEAPQHQGEQTWSYVLRDATSANIRRLVQDPLVEDTHKIDRTRFELVPDVTVERSLGRRWIVVWSAAIAFTVVLLASWILRAAAAVIGVCASAWNLLRASRVVAVATRGVPVLPAEAVGMFRVFFAVGLFVALRDGRLQLVAGYVPEYGELSWEWVRWLATRPDLVRMLEDAILVLLVLVAIGLFTRVAYLLVTSGLVVWLLVRSLQFNAHLWFVTILTVLCLLPVRWDAAFSMDETLRRWRGKGYGAGLRARAFGFAVWAPGLVLGTVWLSAAYAKMDVSGLEWVLGGAVKYHWVIDAQDAAVDWGPWIARHHWAAVLMSFSGVLFESAFILSVFVKPGHARMLLASTGLALILGFYLFHGLLWWTWLLVYLSFVIPWAALYEFLQARVPSRTFVFDATDPISVRAARFRHGLDWLNRTRFVEAHGGPAASGIGIALPRLEIVRELQPIHWLLIVGVCLHATFELPGG